MNKAKSASQCRRRVGRETFCIIPPLTSPPASPWRSWTSCCRRAWCARASPSPPSSVPCRSWRYAAGSSTCSGPAARAKPETHMHHVPGRFGTHWLLCRTNSGAQGRRRRRRSRVKGEQRGGCSICELQAPPGSLPCVLGDLNAALYCTGTPLFYHAGNQTKCDEAELSNFFFFFGQR